MAKAHQHRPPDLLPQNPRKDNEREHRGDTEQEADPVLCVCGAHGGHETAEARDVRGNRGANGLRGGARERMDGMQPEQLRDFGITAQDAGGAPHYEIDHGRECQGSITACRIMPEHDGKDQGEGSPKQSYSYWFARSSWLTTESRTMRYYLWRCLFLIVVVSLIVLVFVAKFTFVRVYII